jgi:hypothetical protein
MWETAMIYHLRNDEVTVKEQKQELYNGVNRTVAPFHTIYTQLQTNIDTVVKLIQKKKLL